MKTIFGANRKHLRRAYYVRVVERNGAPFYVAYSSRDEREDYEGQDARDMARFGYCVPLGKRMYRINVRPRAGHLTVAFRISGTEHLPVLPRGEREAGADPGAE
jgi:hypothetical protein